ncbi:hypothetical protein N9204_00295 [bacterium]|nr:hypothetical protein [bacterium]
MTTEAPTTGTVVKLDGVSSEIVAVNSAWIAARDELVIMSQALEVVNSDQANETASELLRSITKTSNALETYRKKISEPLNLAAKTIKGASDKAREPLETEKARIKSVMATFAEEQFRIAEIARKEAEAEQRKKAEEAFAQQQAAEALGIEDEPEEITIDAAPLPTVAPPKASGSRVSRVISWRIVEEQAVPASFKTVDPKKVNEFLKSRSDYMKASLEKDEQPIPGIEFYEETKISSR